MATINNWNNQIAGAITAITLNAGTNTVGVSTDASTTTVSLATGAGVKTVTLGSTNSTSTTNLQAGSGGIKIPAFAEGALVTSSSGVISTVTGTAGYVLTANTAGTAPSFQAASTGTGNMVLIQSQNASSSSTLDFTSGVTGYTYYVIEFLAVLPATDNTDLQMQYTKDGGSTWEAGTQYVYFLSKTVSSASTFAATNSTGTSQFVLSSGTSNSSAYALYGSANLYGFTNTSRQATSSIVSANSSLATMQALGAMRFTSTTGTVNGVRIKFSSGNIASGTIRLFGVS